MIETGRSLDPASLGMGMVERLPGFVLVSVVALLAVRTVAAQRGYVGEARRQLLSGLRSGAAEERSSAQLQLKAERRQTVKSLLDLARIDSQEPRLRYEKLDAIKLLAEYRAVEACETLVRDVDYSPRFSVIRQNHPLNRFPAANALLQIGEPAIREILFRELDGEQTDSRLQLFAYVIRLHYAPREEEEVGLYRIRRALERLQAQREASSERRGVELGPSIREKNLARLIEIYQEINPNDPKDWPRPARADEPAQRQGEGHDEASEP